MLGSENARKYTHDTLAGRSTEVPVEHAHKWTAMATQSPTYHGSYDRAALQKRHSARGVGLYLRLVAGQG